MEQLKPNGKHRVALIELDFNHNELIKLLKLRGGAMRSKDSKKMIQVEKDIENYLKEHKQVLQRPISAFVTFEYADAVNVILNK